jgi:uncharacterized RDD family membrane protein YckC
MTEQPPVGRQPESAQGGGFFPPRSSAGHPPPPMAGGYPPPPPPAGGYLPPPPVPAIGVLPQSAYTPWITRVLAFLIDYLPIMILTGIGGGIMLALSGGPECIYDSYEVGGAGYCSQTFPVGAAFASVVADLLAMAFAVWNYGYRQGTTGSSIGKSVMNFKVVSERTGQPTGFAMSLVRQLAHFLDGVACFIGYLFPLWDHKRQTFADKIMSTVCLPTRA